MARFLMRRILSGLLILFLFQTVLFFAIQVILPGDFVSHYALSLTSEQEAELRTQLGLDLPLWPRYLRWLFTLLNGNLRSYEIFGEGLPVTAILLDVLPATLLLFGVGMSLAFLLGHWLGRLTAWRGPGLLSGSITFASILLYTSFPPWLGFLLVMATASLGMVLGVGVKTGYSFRLGNVLSGAVIGQMLKGLTVVLLALILLNEVLYRWRRRRIPTLLFLLLAAVGWLISWRVMGLWQLALNVMAGAALPLAAFILLTFGEIMLIMRTSMVDTLHEQYILTARAKGLPPRVIRDRHAARNAVLPVLSRLVINLPYLLTGMVMIEYTFSWEGIGSTLFYAVGMQNIPLALGTIIAIGLFTLTVHLLLDLLVALLDPRIRFTARERGGAL